MSSSTMQFSDVALLMETVAFAAEAHKNQARKNKARTPYINHPVNVCHRIAQSQEVPLHVLQAALLHDCVEDTRVNADDIEKRFGPVVRRIVMECSDDPKLGKADRKQAQIDHAPHRSDDAKHVKLADKLSNLTDLKSTDGVPEGWTAQRIQEYFVWGKKVTDACGKTVNPSLSAQLEELYVNGTFEHEGKTYKAHPTYKGEGKE